MERHKGAAIAKWGAACSPCALAKAKCLRSSKTLSSRCDRCERLDKDCSKQVHKPRKKRQSRPSKTAQLEERLNSLVDLIKATNPGEVPAALRHVSEISSAASCRTEGTVSLPGQEQALLETPATTPGSNHEPTRAIPSPYNGHAPRVCVCRAQAGQTLTLPEPDETLLSIFVNSLMPNYPFITLRPGCTAAELGSERPFLLVTIRMVASYRNVKSMRSQNYFVMRHISEQMMMGSERSLELLQSILLVLGYYHYHCMIHSQMNNLIALANSLVADLGINKPPDPQDKARLLAGNAEKRALCGVWYMTSIISLAFQRIDPPKYTAYIDQCLKDLEVGKEYETDLLLVHLVRIQHFTERISQLNDKSQLGGNDLPGMARTPVSAYAGMFHAELGSFRAALPQSLVSNQLINCHMNTAMLRLWEPPGIDAALLDKISNSLSSLSIDTASSLDIFYRSSAALKSWFDFWLSIDVADYFILPMPASAQLINAVILLARWSKLSSPSPNFVPSSSVVMPPSTQQHQQQQQQQPPTVRDDPACSGMNNASALAALGAKDIDPAIPAAVRAIRNHLLSQPELQQLDVLGILHTMSARFEQARATAEERDRSACVWDNDIWEMAGRKIKGTRVKLVRWAELVAAVGAGEGRRGEQQFADAANASASSNSNTTTVIVGQGEADGISQGQGMEGNWSMDSTAMLEGGGGYNQPTPEGWDPGVAWANDFFDGLGLDQNFFFDGAPEYGGFI
ncbi:uncharacterized protein GGS25DRAFT_534938 [Hypoxylon fragiforme]|uniref:uncharacterized protein n=1 Tax=Hypoxylon fragiforme TaxID=63214 RepID=UPI0020C630D0|nr:uncharacterized protein GGS25DRAFT_534938 [Hypoxylon fragiforme]KAI2604519.1 hypothetical protein GGS25DRAFT_534938 [Hypoxylon fragiforme]